MASSDTNPQIAAEVLLRWYVDMGVDEAIAPHPVDHRTAKTTLPSKDVCASTRATPARPAPPPADEAIAAARALAAEAASPQALIEAIRAFGGCALKSGARNTVVADGVFGADLLVIGEAPGRDEDRIGRPFVGRAGQLLDKMLAAIGRSREKDTLITNVVFWRPPGNRTPTAVETATCRPFVDRLIELTEPKVILLAGGAALQAMMGVSGIMRARGAWREIPCVNRAPIPALPIFHPAFLLRQPQQKRLAWRDLLALKARLDAS